MTTRPASRGLVLLDSEPFGANPLDVSFAGSTHYPLHIDRPQTLQIWAEVPFIFAWSDGTDPPTLPNKQDYPLSGTTAPANTFIYVEFRPGMTIPGGNPVTGLRMVALGPGGTWYCNEWRMFT